MKTNVLVATPHYSKIKSRYLDIAEKLYNSLTFRQKSRALYPNDYGELGARYMGHARARNELIEKFLKDDHSHVFWVDADLVSMPSDIIEQLLAVSERDIVAPMVLMEPVPKGGHIWNKRFYDIGGFVDLDGRRFNPYPPYFDGGQIGEVSSVGSCYIVPAEIYRYGGLYFVRGDEVEHLSLIDQARSMGYKAFVNRDLIVEHAYFPKYGDTSSA